MLTTSSPLRRESHEYEEGRDKRRKGDQIWKADAKSAYHVPTSGHQVQATIPLSSHFSSLLIISLIPSSETEILCSSGEGRTSLRSPRPTRQEIMPHVTLHGQKIIKNN